MLSNFTHFISLLIWAFAQVLTVAICIFCSSFLFAKVFYLVFSLFKFKKHSEKQQERIFKVPQRIYTRFCHIITNLIKYIKDEPMKKEYEQEFFLLRREVLITNNTNTTEESLDKE